MQAWGTKKLCYRNLIIKVQFNLCFHNSKCMFGIWSCNIIMPYLTRENHFFYVQYFIFSYLLIRRAFLLTCFYGIPLDISPTVLNNCVMVANVHLTDLAHILHPFRLNALWIFFDSTYWRSLNITAIWKER